MNSLHSRSAGSSEMGDLDGYSLPGDYGYGVQAQFSPSNEEFGFDPPQVVYAKPEAFSSPTATDTLQLSGWSGFEGIESKDALANNYHAASENLETSRIIKSNLLNSSTAVSRFGQVTPPRSNSATSEDPKSEPLSPKVTTTERRKRSSKTSIKEETEPVPMATTGRKRKTTRKTPSVKDEQDDKRRQSLEKNRLAAAKCRINKKEKTEQLQRNSHDKAVHNAFLKEQVMRMKEEVQQMNALLLAHANCDGCKSPEEIQKHLSNLGNEFFSQHMSSMNYEYPHMTIDDLSQMAHDSAQSDYFTPSHSGSGMLNPPLPDFDRTAEFEVHTPMQTD